MKLFWRRLFYKPNPAYDPEHPELYPKYLKEYRTMVARDDKTPIGCDICPCEQGWNIVTICPCDTCNDDTQGFVGSPVLDGEDQVTADWPGDGLTHKLFALGIDYAAGTDATGSGYAGQPGEFSGNYPRGYALWAIKHETRAAPAYAGNVRAEVFIDGDRALVGTAGTDYWEDEYAPGSAGMIGDGVVGESATTELLQCLHTFSDSGLHRIDLKISFIGANGEGTTSYVVEKILRMGPPSTASLDWIGDVAIAQVEETFDDCGGKTLRVSSPVAGYSPKIPVGMVVLKGPFDTRADAEYVLATWGGFIAAYAQTCVCESSCATDVFCADGVDSYGGGLILTMFAAGGEASAGCETGWLKYEATFDEEMAEAGSYSIEPRLFLPDGTDSSAGWSGLIPPCAILYFKITGVSAPYDFGGFSPIGGNFSPLEPTTVCCAEDSGSPYFEEEWDYTPGDAENPPTGVPANSANVANWKEFGT